MTDVQMVPVRFYFDIESGKFADLEVVSRASIELVSALRDFVHFAEPTIDLRMTLQQGDKGSLDLKAFVKLFTGRTDKDKANRDLVLQAMIGGAIMFLLQLTGNHYGDKILDHIDAYVEQWFQDAPETAELSQQEKAAMCAEAKGVLEGAINNKTAVPHMRKFYAEIRRDPAIVGVALASGHENDKPDTIIPREEFSDRAAEPLPEEDETKRTRTERMPILLIQPRLHADKKAWRFSVGGLEFGARIEDEKFVDDMLSGQLPVPAVEGVYFDVDLTLTEERHGGAWEVKSRRITRVHRVIARPEQQDLLSSINEQSDSSDNNQDDSEDG
ncbi:MAG: hypothetical protein JXR35_04100 [Rhodobacteraceae bacterium]|nr:hypothetical protein [Paracoccaceae bacterium]